MEKIDPAYEASDGRAFIRDEEVTALGHDLRGPLSVIALDVELLEHDLPAASQHAHRTLTRIVRNLSYIDRLLRELLDLAVVSTARLELEREPVELAGLVRAVVERMTSPAQRARVLIEAEAPTSVLGDAPRLERVVANFLHNALKFSATDAAIIVDVRVHEGRARATVTDHGPGMTPEEAARVFEKFERARPTSRGGGSGLGLYISRKIIEAHGGTIGVESTPGRGSAFFLELPLLAI